MSRLMKALLILGFEFFLVVPTCVQNRSDRGIKTSEQYWTETDLGSSELEGLLANESCYAGQQTFLACVNAINQIAEKYDLTLTSGSDSSTLKARLKRIEPQDIEERSTEKKQLEKWLPFFEKEEVSPGISFLEIWHQLDQKYIKPSERSAVIASGINGFLSIYKDPHTYIMPLAMYEEVIASSESRNANVGFVARRNQGRLIVRKVFEGSPAEIAGIHKGDQIIAINGQKISNLLSSRVYDLLKMNSSYRIGFQIERPKAGGKEQKFIELMKTEMTYPSVASKVLEGSRRVGLVTIHKFSKSVCDMTRAQIQSLKEQNIQGIMLDLRDNPGGQVEEAACIVNLFVDKGTLLFETRYLESSKPADQYITEQEPVYKGPVAVLINSGSASASEIVAGALKDQNRAKLIGEKTFGKGSFQDGRIWGPNPKIALFQTEGLYYFPSGWTPQMVGLEPDITVNFNLAENSREQELFFNPIKPIDSWPGTQSLSWLTERECDRDMDLLASMDAATEADPQMKKAQAWLSCGGENHGRNGSL